ncbi:MAG: ribonuclease H [Halobacteriales archaeon]
MAAPGRPALRDLFDDAQTPLIGHPPRTHHLEYYVATDGSYRGDRGGLGAVIETHDGRRVARVARSDVSPDNNVAEYRALHLGLDVLATRVPPSASVGILVDHDQLARNVNAVVLGQADPAGSRPAEVVVPPSAGHHWRGIRARLATVGDVRAARVDGATNPAHPLANDPEAYEHLGRRPDRCVIARTPWRRSPDTVPPPSRARGSPSD